MMTLPRPLPALFGVLTALVMATATCTASAPAPDHTPTPSPPSRLEQALARVPLAHANSFVQFADAQGAAGASGVPDFGGLASIAEGESDEQPRYFAGLPRYSNPYGFVLYEEIGVDLLGFDLAVWASANATQEGAGFLVMQEGFDAGRLTEELSDFGYLEEAHAGTTYLRPPDEGLGPDKNLTQILMFTSSNVMAPLDDWLLVAASEEGMTGLIEVQEQESASLLSSAPHRAIAEAVGQELLGATFWPDEYFRWPYGFPNLRMEPTQQDELIADWLAMQRHELALLGYRVVDGQEEVLVAMFYPDPEAAAGNAGEIEARWRSLVAADLDPFGEEGADLCAELTTQAVTVEGGSVLVASCPVTQEQTSLGIGHIWTQGLHGKLGVIRVPEPQDIEHFPVD